MSGKFTADSLLTELSAKSIQFEWVQARARVNYKEKSKSKNFTASVRIRRDSIIWISITSIMGVEVARLQVRSDSVFLLDRLNNKYRAEALSFLENYFPFRFDISGLIQKIIVGEPLVDEDKMSSIKQNKKGYVISSENELYHHTLNLNEHDLTISTEHLADRQNDRKLSLIFDDYKSDSGKLFSYVRNIQFDGDEKINLTVKFSKVKWDDPQAFPFHIGDKYSQE